MLNTVRDFLRKIEFFDEHELEKIQEHTREPAFSESTTVSRSQSLVEMDKENLDPKHVTEKSQKIADTAVENSTKPVVCSGDI